MEQITGEMPLGAMGGPKIVNNSATTQNMGELFRATALKSAQPQDPPPANPGMMPGEEAHMGMAGKMPGE